MNITAQQAKEIRRTPVRIIPLGGLNEIGKNITVFEYGDDIVVIDAGMGFPDEDMLGIDLVIPDISYLVKNADKVSSVLNDVIGDVCGILSGAAGASIVVLIVKEEVENSSILIKLYLLKILQMIVELMMSYKREIKILSLLYSFCISLSTP